MNKPTGWRSIALKLLPVPLIVVAVAVLLPLLGQSDSRPTRAASSSALMHFDVDGADSCDHPDEPTSCTVTSGNTFTLNTVADALPGGNYVGFQTDIFYGGLEYRWAAMASDEVVWPDSFLPVRAPAEPNGKERRVELGSSTGLFPPLPQSSFLGDVVDIVLFCPGPGTFTVALLPYEVGASPNGAAFLMPDESIVAAKGAGQENIDLDGDTTAESVDVSASVDITCVGTAPTPTPPPSSPPPSSHVITVRTSRLAIDGQRPVEQKCRADAVVVVDNGRISEFKAKLDRFPSSISDNIAALDGRTGAFIMSVARDGTIVRGPRDCVEVDR